MSFNAVGSLLAVSSAHDTVHVFKLGPRQGSGSSSSSKKDRPSSPMESVDSRDPEDGGDYDSFLDERKKSNSMSSMIRRRSSHLTKSISSSVGGYLPNTLTEIWEPARDFAFLRLPTSGARCVVGLSRWVSSCAWLDSFGLVTDNLNVVYPSFRRFSYAVRFRK